MFLLASMEALKVQPASSMHTGSSDTCAMGAAQAHPLRQVGLVVQVEQHELSWVRVQPDLDLLQRVHQRALTQHWYAGQRGVAPYRLCSTAQDVSSAEEEGGEPRAPAFSV